MILFSLLLAFSPPALVVDRVEVSCRLVPNTPNAQHWEVPYGGLESVGDVNACIWSDDIENLLDDIPTDTAQLVLHVEPSFEPPESHVVSINVSGEVDIISVYLSAKVEFIGDHFIRDQPEYILIHSSGSAALRESILTIDTSREDCGQPRENGVGPDGTVWFFTFSVGVHRCEFWFQVTGDEPLFGLGQMLTSHGQQVLGEYLRWEAAER
ncbi:hypothetical protein [Hyphobacterium indicum]|uniref:hypothetical protein n=1 Tax=Hyphobacterium indicum TaxID=2162714 RepID=UPI000D641C7B|nr:hypothetical protein [Hyphobacterium indicum]